MTSENDYDATEKFYDQQKENAGKFATFVWIGVGIWLIWSNANAAFLSWQAAVYFIIGMFVAAIVFGMVIYLIQRGIAKVVLTTTSELSSRNASFLSSVGFLLMLGEAVVIYFAARYIIYEVLF